MEWFKVPNKRRRGVHSRKRAGRWQNLWELFWPSMGWRAVGRWLVLKLVRQAEDPHKVALGAAVGVGISFLPTPGLAGVLSALVAWALRANIAAALIAQVVGNPWTAGFIWWGTYELGRVFWPVRGEFNLGMIMDNLGWEYMRQHGMFLLEHVLVPMLIGGVLLGGIFGLAVYFAVRWEVARFWEKRRLRLRGKK